MLNVVFEDWIFLFSNTVHTIFIQNFENFINIKNNNLYALIILEIESIKNNYFNITMNS